MSEARRLRLMRMALTRATSKWGLGGQAKKSYRPKPVTLARPAPNNAEQAEHRQIKRNLDLS